MSLTDYIYGLRDPRDGKIKYVGQTRNPAARYDGHGSLPRKHALTAKEQWIKDLRDAGTKPEMVILERAEVGRATDIAEKKWIREAQAHGPIFNRAGTVEFSHPQPTQDLSDLPTFLARKMSRSDSRIPRVVHARAKAHAGPAMAPQSKVVIESYLGAPIPAGGLAWTELLRLLLAKRGASIRSAQTSRANANATPLSL